MSDLPGRDGGLRARREREHLELVSANGAVLRERIQRFEGRLRTPKQKVRILEAELKARSALFAQMKQDILLLKRENDELRAALDRVEEEGESWRQESA